MSKSYISNIYTHMSIYVYVYTHKYTHTKIVIESKDWRNSYFTTKKYIKLSKRKNDILVLNQLMSLITTDYFCDVCHTIEFKRYYFLIPWPRPITLLPIQEFGFLRSQCHNSEKPNLSIKTQIVILPPNPFPLFWGPNFAFSARPS